MVAVPHANQESQPRQRPHRRALPIATTCEDYKKPEPAESCQFASSTDSIHSRRAHIPRF